MKAFADFFFQREPHSGSVRKKIAAVPGSDVFRFSTDVIVTSRSIEETLRKLWKLPWSLKPSFFSHVCKHSRKKLFSGHGDASLQA